MANSVDPDQMASSEAIWSGSILFAKVGVVVNSKIRVNIRQVPWNMFKTEAEIFTQSVDDYYVIDIYNKMSRQSSYHS